MCILFKKIFNAQGCVQTVDHETAALFASKSLQQLICLVIRTKLNVLLLITHSSAVCLVAFGMIYPACKLVFLKTALCESLRYFFYYYYFCKNLPISYAIKSEEKHLAPWLMEVSLCVFPPNTSMVPLIITAVCK